MTTPEVAHSVTHTHARGTLQKQLDGRAIWLYFLKGVPRPGVSNTATPVRIKSAEFPSQTLSLCLSLRFSCCDACLLSSSPVDGLLCFPGKFKTPGRPQGLLHFKGTNKLFLPQSGFIRQFSAQLEAFNFFAHD